MTAPITGYTGTWGFVARAIDPNGLASELSAEATTTLVNRAPKDVFAGNLIASQDHQYLGGAQPYRASIPFTGGSVGSDPDGDLPCYQWEFEGSAVAGACLWDGTTCAASYTLPAASVGTLELRGQQGIASAAGVQHRVCLRATDWFGSTFVSCRGVTVGDRPPSISLSGPTALNIDTSRAAANTACNLVCGVHAYTVTATVSDPDGDPVNLSWLRSVVGACTVSTPADCAAGCSASVTVTCPGTYSGGGSASFTATATDPFGVSTTSAPLGTSFPPHCLGVNACP